MASVLRRRLWGATAGASFLIFACGEEESDAGEAGAPAPDAAIGARPDGGLEIRLAELADDVAGAPCLEDVDCEGKNAQCSIGNPLAVRSCTGMCTADEHCGAGGTCVETVAFGSGRLSFCQKLCSSDADCDPELQCRTGVDVGALINGLSGLLEGRLDSWMLEPTPKVCQEKAHTVRLPDGVVGSACSADEACGGGICSDSPLAPGGYCTGNCVDDEECGVHAKCARDFASASLGVPGVCLLTCEVDADCRESEGYGCLQTPVFVGEDHYCVTKRSWPDDPFMWPFGDEPPDAGT